jgi:hypothetical protein
METAIGYTRSGMHVRNPEESATRTAILVDPRSIRPTVPDRRRLRWLRAALAAVLLLGVAVPVMADYWYEHYARAENALEAKDWSLAVAELQEALERKGDSGARVRSYGMKVIAYFPYLKLGIAYYHLVPRPRSWSARAGSRRPWRPSARRWPSIPKTSRRLP